MVIQRTVRSSVHGRLKNMWAIPASLTLHFEEKINLQDITEKYIVYQS